MDLKKSNMPSQQKTCNWSHEEDAKLLSLHSALGNKWTEISRTLGGRTDNAVKNRYATLSRKMKPSHKRKRSKAPHSMRTGEERKSRGRQKKLSQRSASLNQQEAQPLPGPLGCQSNSHAYYARMRAGHPYSRQAHSPNENPMMKQEQEFYPFDTSAKLEQTIQTIDQEDKSRLRQPKAQSGPPLLTAQIGRTGNRRSELCVNMHDYELGKFGRFSQEVSSSYASSEHDSEFEGSQDASEDFPFEEPRALSSLGNSEPDHMPGTFSELVGPVTVSYSSAESTQDSTWDDAAFDGWVAENFTAEDMDQLLPTLNALMG